MRGHRDAPGATRPRASSGAAPLIDGPVTILTDQTAEITVTNLLIELQGTPVLTIDKSNDAPTAGAGRSRTVTPSPTSSTTR